MQKLLKNTKLLKGAVTVVLVLLCGILYSCNRSSLRNVQKNDAKTAETQAVSRQETSEQAGLESKAVQEEAKLFVYVSGCVQHPGVYEVALETRMFQVIELAGGITEEGCDTWLNLAQPLQDGQRIYVPSQNEATQEAWQNQLEQNAAAIGNSGASAAAGHAKVNINTATKEQLMTLPGVGAAKAEDIIVYRKNNGGYSKIEDIMNISGIKEAAFNKLKDRICV